MPDNHLSDKSLSGVMAAGIISTVTGNGTLTSHPPMGVTYKKILSVVA